MSAAPNTRSMATPEGLTVQEHLELAGRERRPYVRWALLGGVVVLLLLGLLGLFGQPTVESSAETDEARFTVSAPTRLRGGLLFESRIQVEAREEIEDAWVVLDEGWLDDVTLNTLAPSPVEETSRDGRLALRLGRITSGERYVLHLHFQVNPTAVGSRSQGVRLLDGDRELASFERDAWVWP
jgi:hypothetical protein